MFRIQMLAFTAAVILAVILCLYFTLPRIFEESSGKPIVLQQKINPNDATPESLSRLPGIGPSRAQAIVTYRENFGKNGPAFETCDDLQNVKGIGPVTAENICDWLKFE